MGTSQTGEPGQEEPPARWFQRVLPISVLCLTAVFLLAVLVPSFRTQLRLSTTRMPEPYVELYFADASPGTVEGGQLTCARDGAHVLVEFVIRSHLINREPISHVVVVDPVRRGEATMRSRGRAVLDPGEADRVQESFRLGARQPYSVSVELPGREQHLHARCAGRGTR